MWFSDGIPARRGGGGSTGALACLAGLLPWVAEAGNPALDELRRTYEQDVDRTVLPLRGGYCRALLALEQQLAGKGDYAAARLVREERLLMEKITGDGSGAAAGAGGTAPSAEKGAAVPISMAGAEGGMAAARLGMPAAATGAVRAENGMWTGWREAGDALRWVLPAGLAAGGYALELIYTCEDAGELAVEFREDFHTLARSLKLRPATSAVPSGEPPPSAEPPVEAGKTEGVSAPRAVEQVWRTGTLRLRPGAAALEMKLVRALPEGAGFRLREVRLIPESGEAKEDGS